jgi:peptidoglycan/LPS O-acetylase OafA/YrhL
MSSSSGQSGPGSTQVSHVPALDGVRGIAVLLVMVHHFTIYGGPRATDGLDRLFYQAANSSWAGVDVFFALSGFLITGILLDAKGGDRYFRSFYARRVLRIFPLYYAALILFLIILPRWAHVSVIAPLDHREAWFWTYLINVKIALDGWRSSFALAHFWSLAVEEQFYLLWPAVVLLLSRRALLRLCLACMAGSLLLRAGLHWHGDRLAAYVLTPARLDTLAVGAWLAAYIREPGGVAALRRWSTPVFAVTGAAVLALFIWRGPGQKDWVMQTIGFTVIACASAALVAVATGAERGWGRALSKRPLVVLGKYSYGLYVFHHPLLFLKPAWLSSTLIPPVLGSLLPGRVLFIAGGVGVSLAIALLSWHAYEKHFLKLKRLFPYSRERHRVVIVPVVNGGEQRDWLGAARNRGAAQVVDPAPDPLEHGVRPALTPPQLASEAASSSEAGSS